VFIKKVEIKNFRCIREECLECDNITALIGRNGSGKSSFLQALDVFYNVSSRITEEDFFNREIDNPIEIRVTYSNLRDIEKEEFGSFVRDNKLIVTKKISFENGKPIQQYFGATMQLPKFAEIRSLEGKRERVAEWNRLVDNPGDLVGLGERARGSDAVEVMMTTYEEAHPDALVPFEREQQFFGSKNIGGGKLDKYTKYLLIPAVKEVTDELDSRRGAIYQILDTVVLRQIERREDIRAFKKRVSEEAKKLYSSDNLKEIYELGGQISTTLRIFAPDSELFLDWQEFEMPDIPTPSAIATLAEDNFKGEISRKGHGLQRALVFALLQHLAMLIEEEEEEEYEEEDTGVIIEGEVEQGEIKQDNVENNEDVGTDEGESEYYGPDLIIAIEEPELYLYPARCRYMRDILFKLAEKSEDNMRSKNQVLYTTHSPFLLELDHFEQIRLVRKRPSGECEVAHSSVKYYTFTQLSEELARICGLNADDFTRDSIKARAASVMNTIVNEGFFADVAVVVEGISDVGIFWKMQDILEKNWAQLGIVVVPAGVKNNIDRPTLIFRGFSIPTYFVFDGDSKFKGKGNKNEENTIKRNGRYLCMAGVDIEDFPETRVEDDWAVFANKIEEDIHKAIGDEKSIEIKNKVAEELGYDEADNAIKNVEGAARLIEAVYESGLRIPILEEIVERITALRQ